MEVVAFLLLQLCPLEVVLFDQGLVAGNISEPFFKRLANLGPENIWFGWDAKRPVFLVQGIVAFLQLGTGSLVGSVGPQSGSHRFVDSLGEFRGDDPPQLLCLEHQFCLLVLDFLPGGQIPALASGNVVEGIPQRLNQAASALGAGPDRDREVFFESFDPFTDDVDRLVVVAGEQDGCSPLPCI